MELNKEIIKESIKDFMRKEFPLNDWKFFIEDDGEICIQILPVKKEES